MVRRVLFAMSLCAVFQVASSAQGPGGISGTLTGDDGKPVAGATVSAHRTQPSPTVSAQATSQSNGSFDLKGLAAGTYKLCAQVPSGGFLDPCHWSTQPTQITLTAGQLSTGNSLILRKGAIFKVRLIDAGKLLQPSQGLPPHILMGIWSPMTPFYPLTRVASDPAGVDYQVTIPFDSPVRFSIPTAKVQLADAAAKPINRSGVCPSGPA